MLSCSQQLFLWTLSWCWVVLNSCFCGHCRDAELFSTAVSVDIVVMLSCSQQLFLWTLSWCWVVLNSCFCGHCRDAELFSTAVSVDIVVMLSCSQQLFLWTLSWCWVVLNSCFCGHSLCEGVPYDGVKHQATYLLCTMVETLSFRYTSYSVLADETETDCCAQNGSTQSCLYATFQCQVFQK